MPGFCSNCAAPLETGTKFCSACAAPVEAVLSPTAVTQPSRPGPPPVRAVSRFLPLLAVIGIVAVVGAILFYRSSASRSISHAASPPDPTPKTIAVQAAITQAEKDSAQPSPDPAVQAISDLKPLPTPDFAPILAPGTQSFAPAFSATGDFVVAEDRVFLQSEATASFSFSVPQGQTQAVEYGIPAGRFVNNAPVEIWVNDVNLATVAKNLGGLGVKTPHTLHLWRKAFAPGNYVLTLKSLGQSVNVYGFWLTTDDPPRITGVAKEALHTNAGDLTTSFGVGSAPVGIAFDGANIWVVNNLGNTVTKLRASDGIMLGTFRAGNFPREVIFDGANIWISNGNDNNTVTKLRASDGTTLGTFSVGRDPERMAFDGANIWVGNNLSNSVTKLRASDGKRLATCYVGNGPNGVASAGANIWVANAADNTVWKLRATDCSIEGKFKVPNPDAIAFDGANVWVTNYQSNTVTKMRTSDGAVLGTFGVGSDPVDIAFDGVNIWTANYQSSNVTKLEANSGKVLGTFAIETSATRVAFDGANIWVTGNNSGTVSRMPASLRSD